MKINIEIAKEPRGFIKFLQIVLAILAFSSTAGFSTYFSFHAVVDDCKQGPLDSPIKQAVVYPFQLNAQSVTHQLCQDPAVSVSLNYGTDVSSDSRLFVAVGVVAMLYAAAAAIVYVIFSDLYEDITHAPTLDFCMHVLLTVLWFLSSCSWASGVTVLKSATDADQAGSVWCEDYSSVTCSTHDGDSRGHYSGLNVSLIFGFLNTFVWTANLWFLYKETPFFHGNSLSRPRANITVNTTVSSPSPTSTTVPA